MRLPTHNAINDWDLDISSTALTWTGIEMMGSFWAICVRTCEPVCVCCVCVRFICGAFEIGNHSKKREQRSGKKSTKILLENCQTQCSAGRKEFRWVFFFVPWIFIFRFSVQIFHQKIPQIELCKFRSKCSFVCERCRGCGPCTPKPSLGFIDFSFASVAQHADLCHPFRNGLTSHTAFINLSIKRLWWPNKKQLSISESKCIPSSCDSHLETGRELGVVFFASCRVQSMAQCVDMNTLDWLSNSRSDSVVRLASNSKHTHAHRDEPNHDTRAIPYRPQYLLCASRKMRSSYK